MAIQALDGCIFESYSSIISIQYHFLTQKMIMVIVKMIVITICNDNYNSSNSDNILSIYSAILTAIE